MKILKAENEVKLKNDNIYDTILLFLEAVLLQLVLIP
jgi:hypothetical protein